MTIHINSIHSEVGFKTILGWINLEYDGVMIRPPAIMPHRNHEVCFSELWRQNL